MSHRLRMLENRLPCELSSCSASSTSKCIAVSACLCCSIVRQSLPISSTAPLRDSAIFFLSSRATIYDRSREFDRLLLVGWMDWLIGDRVVGCFAVQLFKYANGFAQRSGLIFVYWNNLFSIHQVHQNYKLLCIILLLFVIRTGEETKVDFQGNCYISLSEHTHTCARTRVSL